MASEDLNAQLEQAKQQVELQPDSPKAHFNLGLAYSKKGVVDPAEAAYRKALELDPDLLEAWVNLGGVLMARWDFKGSLEANREALLRKASADESRTIAVGQGMTTMAADGIRKAAKGVTSLEEVFCVMALQ